MVGQAADAPGPSRASSRPVLRRPGLTPALGGHSLKRGAMNTAKDRRVHPAQLKQLGRHRSYATLATYIEEGDLFEDNALNGVLQASCPAPPICPGGSGCTRSVRGSGSAQRCAGNLAEMTATLLGQIAGRPQSPNHRLASPEMQRQTGGSLCRFPPDAGGSACAPKTWSPPVEVASL